MEGQAKNPCIAVETCIKENLKIRDSKSLCLSEDNSELDKAATEGQAEACFNELLDQNPYDALASLEDEEEETEEVTEENKSNPMNEQLKELSRVNGQINRMRMEQLKKRLKQYNLDTNGTRNVLQKRLKVYFRRKDLKEQEHRYDYFLVIDFEATCDVQPNNYRHEIIEFPAVLVSTKKKMIVSKFQTYVRPVINPKLTAFCTSLTGITQEQVNFAPVFPEVLRKFEDWMKEKRLKCDMKSFALVTDGPWDMGRFLYHQCRISKVPYPYWAKTWINLKKPFCNFYDTERMNLQGMLTKLGMTFIGQPHSGLDDAYNIARLAIKMYEDGANMRVNEQINFKRPKNFDHRMYTVKNVSRSSFNAMMKRKSVDPPREDEVKSDDDDVVIEEEEDFDFAGPIFDATNDEDFPSLVSKPSSHTAYNKNFPSLVSKSTRDTANDRHLSSSVSKPPSDTTNDKEFPSLGSKP